MRSESQTEARRIGSYILERELGRGGIGAVFVGVHETIGKRAAIKILLPNPEYGEEMLQRFVNEARAASSIRHPGIVEVFDLGVDKGHAYIVMELLEGTSLAKRLDRLGALPIHKAVAIAKQVALALAAAHDAGIVHRDLKPDNIFLRADDDKVVILDFGIAKLAPHANPGAAPTVTGMLLGTPQYMSPEQCEGARNVDHRSDLYSLGVTLFHMLTGRLPFEAEGIGGYIGAHLHVPAPPLQRYLPTASDALAGIVERLLAKSPATRFPSATALAKALAESEKVTAEAKAPLPEVRALPPLGMSGSHRRFVFSGIAIAACLVIFALMSVAGRRSGMSVDRDEAVQAQQLAAPTTTANTIETAARSGDQAAVFTACQASPPTRPTEIGPCLIAACTQRDGAQARAWYKAFRQANRTSDAANAAVNECYRLGVERITLDDIPNMPTRRRR